MFESIPTYNAMRTLRLHDPMLVGEDVFALQNAMQNFGFFVHADGYFGPQTDKVLHSMQRDLGIEVDGQAGGITQKTIAMSIATSVSFNRNVPREALLGQLEHESGFRLGNYSPLRPDGSYDAGVAQRNTNFVPPTEGFKVLASIVALTDVIRKHFDLFAGVKPVKRRWGLAQGAWNAPAFACYLAREEGATKVMPNMTLKPSVASRTTFESYISNVSKYLTV